MKIDWIKLVLCIVICNLAGVFGALFTAQSIPSWYVYLDKPFFSPPNWLFGPVWTALYTLMGISFYMILVKGTKKKEGAVKAFVVQLTLNAIWTPLFFGLRMPMIAFFEIILLLAAIIVTIIKFWKISKPAAYLLVPYLLWVMFASVLNFSLWILNV
jgi:tryptophan-rich sensory protein